MIFYQESVYITETPSIMQVKILHMDGVFYEKKILPLAPAGGLYRSGAGQCGDPLGPADAGGKNRAAPCGCQFRLGGRPGPEAPHP